jgi:hypothetical protein
VTEVFVSYSRCDRRFAERATTVLREANIECFLDVALLSPGNDWARAVDEALDQCSAVVLIASRESLASPSCAREWRRAIRAGKPVVVAGIEQIEIPDELRGQPAVDMRGFATTCWTRLIHAVKGQPEHATSLAHLRVPPPLLLASTALVALLAFQISALISLFERANRSMVPPPASAIIVAHCLIVVAWNAYTAWWLWRFLRREKTALGLVKMTFVPCMWMLSAIFTLDDRYEAAGLLFLAMAGITLLTLKSLAWWLPSREPMRRTRSFVLDPGAHPALLPRPIVRGAAMRYQMRHAPQDALIAERIADVLAGDGHRPAAPGTAATARLLVLSNATSVAFEPLCELGLMQTPTICIVASTIALDGAPSAFHRYHWIDYRRHDRGVLAALAGWLRDPEHGSEALAAESLEPWRVVLPVGVGFVSGALAVASGILLFGALAQTLQTAVLDKTPEPMNAAYGLAAGLTAALAAAVLRARAVTSGVFFALYAAAFVLTCAYVDMLLPELTLVAGITLACTQRRLRSWLLAHPLEWTGYPTIAPQPIGWFVARQVITVLLPAIAAAVIVASGDLLHRLP